MRKRWLQVPGIIFAPNSSTVYSTSSKYAASKIFNGSEQFLSFCMVHIYIIYIMWVLWLFSLSRYTAIQSTTSVRSTVQSSHIVSIRTGLKSRWIWDWSAVIHTISGSRSSLYVYQVYTCKMGIDLVSVAVYQSITIIRRRTIRFWSLMYGLWLAQNSPKTIESCTK